MRDFGVGGVKPADFWTPGRKTCSCAAAAWRHNCIVNNLRLALPCAHTVVFNLCIIMGNINDRSSGGSPLDLFQTPPMTPSEADLALSVSSFSSKTQTPSLDMAAHASLATTFAVTDWAQKLSPPSEWAVLSVDSVISQKTNINDEVVGHEKVRAFGLHSLTSVPESRAWPLEQSWQERDSGLEPQAVAERSAEELTLTLLSLMEQYKTSLGLSSNDSMGAEDLLRHLIAERDRLAGEVNSLREMLRTERLEWHRFQRDLQIAVSVAERLREESQQALNVLQGNHRSVQHQLAQAYSRQQETERELERLRSEQRDVSLRLSELEGQQQRKPETEDTTACREKTETQDSEKVQGMDRQNVMEEDEVTQVQGQKEEPATNEESPGKTHLRGKGIAEGYLRSLAAREKKNEGRSQSEPRKIVMSERSRSMSRLPVPSDAINNNPIHTSTTLPPCKKEEPAQTRRTTDGLKRVDSCSSCYAGKQAEKPNSDFIKLQDRVHCMPRRHSGSRRNSLLFWCQSRTQGYQNIDITNFSTCWEDGLAFCAVYHTYLPTHIPYNRLNPADKKGNLELAFRTGESIGITPTLSTEEMLKSDGPDWQKVLGYVESIFHHFEK